MIEQLCERLHSMDEPKAREVARIAMSICEIIDVPESKHIPCKGEPLENITPTDDKLIATAQHVLDKRAHETTWLERATCQRFVKGHKLLSGDLARMLTLFNTYYWEVRL